MLANTPEHQFFISDYSFHTIGTILFGKKKQDSFRQFVKDFIVRTGADILALLKDEMEAVIKTSKECDLDFDDAYQYTLAEANDLILVSFDKDFDHTPRGRKTPVEILQP